MVFPMGGMGGGGPPSQYCLNTLPKLKILLIAILVCAIMRMVFQSQVEGVMLDGVFDVFTVGAGGGRYAGRSLRRIHGRNWRMRIYHVKLNEVIPTFLENVGILNGMEFGISNGYRWCARGARHRLRS